MPRGAGELLIAQNILQLSSATDPRENEWPLCGHSCHCVQSLTSLQLGASSVNANSQWTRARNRVNYQHESLHAVVSGLSVSAVFGVGLRLATVDAARSNSKGKQARYLIGKYNGKITSVSE